MEIEFVNHASFVVKHGNVAVITDPWLEGRVFNQGWDLLSGTRFSYARFAEITHIWFSHEHPDHFSPPVLKKIPAEFRSAITVLFQDTADKRVAAFCEEIGFKEVIGLRPDEWLELTPGLKLLCEYFDEGDSWICFKSGDLTLLNTNDCAISKESEAEKIRKKTGAVDILMTQFSYAYWAGNRNDKVRREKVAAEKLELLKFQCLQFSPRVVIPMASFIYFCHEENFYLNDSMNDVRKTWQFIRANTAAVPVILYNGDVYRYGEPWDSEAAIRKYMEDLEKVRNGSVILVQNKPVAEEQLFHESRLFSKRLLARTNLFLRLYLRPSRVHCHDLGKTYELSVRRGLRAGSFVPEGCDVSLSSESLLFCLKFPYGLDTTQINGRMQKPPLGNYRRFYNLFRIMQQESRGKKTNLLYLLAVLRRKALSVFRVRR
jgi:L-ascorbate metabolism protein UlaG (beta-lactamase superfamily)